MKKTCNIISGFLFFAIIMTIIVSTIFKVYTNHRSDLLKVVNQRIAEAGEKCVLEGICTEEKFTLDFLIQNKYIDSIVHPITKEYVSIDTEVVCSNYNCTSEVK